jgi:hypothetical protein
MLTETVAFAFATIGSQADIQPIFRPLQTSAE